VKVPFTHGQVSIGIGGIGSKEGQPTLTITHETEHTYNSVTYNVSGSSLLHSAENAIRHAGPAIVAGLVTVGTAVWNGIQNGIKSAGELIPALVE
jgi:hypothetical protein